MIDVPSEHAKSGGVTPFGGHPVALAAGALVVIVLGIGSIAMWRAYTGTSPEPDRVVATRQLQARTAEISEQLVDKTKALETTQQESIDQLQVVQDQLQTVKRLLAAQQADNKRLSEQVTGLTEAVDSLRQSFASVQSSDAAAQSARNQLPVRSRPQAVRTVVHRKPPKSRS
jgi:hypothetical protein